MQILRKEVKDKAQHPVFLMSSQRMLLLLVHRLIRLWRMEHLASQVQTLQLWLSMDSSEDPRATQEDFQSQTQPLHFCFPLWLLPQSPPAHASGFSCLEFVLTAFSPILCLSTIC